jgi:hypothetical protein
MDDAHDLVAHHPGVWNRARRAESRHAVFHLSRVGSAMRLRRRQLRFLDGQYQLLLPQSGERQRARAQCRARQSRGQRGAIRDPARDHRRCVRLVRRRSADRGRGWQDLAAVAAECRLHLDPVYRRRRLRGLVRHERHRGDEGLVRGAGGDLPAQTQLADVLALYRHLRLVHRLLGRFSDWPRRSSRPSTRSNWPSLAPSSAPSRVPPPAGSPTVMAAAASPSGCS